MLQNFVSKNHLKVSLVHRSSSFRFEILKMNYSRTFFSYSFLTRMCTKDGKILIIKLDISKSHFISFFKFSKKKYFLKKVPRERPRWTCIQEPLQSLCIERKDNSILKGLFMFTTAPSPATVMRMWNCIENQESFSKLKFYLGDQSGTCKV